MWLGLDIIPHAPTFLDGERYHPEAVRALRTLGEAYADVGGVVVVSPHFYDPNAFPVNPGDPLEEASDWKGFPGLPANRMRRWDGLPFLAETLQRCARTRGVPVALRHGFIDHAVWAPLRWMFPSEPIPVLPVGVSGLGPQNHYRMGQAIRDAVLDAPKPIAVLISTNLTYRPDWVRYDKSELPAAGRAVDAALLHGISSGDWQPLERLDTKLLRDARPEGGVRLWSLIKGLSEGLRGDVRYYGPSLGAFGQALIHFDPPGQVGDAA